MADLNVKNRSITTGDFEFSGGVVTAISGYPIGGTGGTIVGITYHGDGSTIDVNNDTRVITIHELYKQKIDSIPHNVSDLSDSANYYNKNECDERFVLSADYNTKISEIDSGLAYLSANKQDNLIFDYYNNNISAINGSAINVNGNFYSASNPSGFVNSEQVGTQIDEKLQNYYLKTNTSGKDELSDAFNNIMKYNVTAQQGCDVTSAVDNGVTTFGISITATPIVTDTTLSGYNGIAAAKDSDVSGQWNVGLTHDMLNNINGKLDTTVAAQTYQPKGDYLSANALTNYYTKSETSGATEISTALGNKVDKPDTSFKNNYLVLRTNNDGSVSGWTDILDKVYSKSEADGTFQKKTDMGSYLTTAQYATDSATFVTSGDYISGSKQYALTSGGWKEISANTDYTAGTDLRIDENNIISVDTNGNANNTATNNHNFVEGSWTLASGYNCHAEGVATSALGYGVHTQGMWTCFSSNNGDIAGGGTGPIYWGIGAGAAVEGYCNATTSCPMSGTAGEESYGPIHGGILKVIGNGYVENKDHETDVHVHYPSDALILYRDGSMWVQGPISANGIELGNYIPTLPLNIYGNTVNTVANNSIGAIGNKCNVGEKSFALSYEGASAYQNSMALGDSNYASANSFAAGWKVKAQQYSVIFGHGTTNEPSETYNYSIAAGDAVFAYNYSQAFGRGLIASGHQNGKGMMVIGGWNKTSAEALFVIGNGTNSDIANRNDALVVYYNGSIVAGNNNNVTQNNAYVEGLNHTVTTAGTTSYGHGYNHIEGAYNTANGGLYNHIEGESNVVYGDRVHMEGNRNIFSAGDGGNTWGISIEGMGNATTANVSEHGGILKIIGNGTYGSGGTIGTRSDALRLYRDGSLWILGSFSANTISNANGTDSVGSYSGINNIQVYPAGTSTANFPNDNVIRIILEA